MEEMRWVWVPFSVDAQYNGLRVDVFLSRRLFGYSRAKVQTILCEGRVFRGNAPDVAPSALLLEGEGGLRASTRVRTGERIVVGYRRLPEPPVGAHVKVPVLFEDTDYLIVDKPAGMLSHPTDKVLENTVTGWLRRHHEESRFHLLHRLDRETSGAIALAKHPEAARRWTRAMQRRQIQKTYIAFVLGHPSPSEGTLDAPIGNQGGSIYVRQWINTPGAAAATTRYRTLTTGFFEGKEIAAIEAQPTTGRMHQIRVHLAAAGWPLLGDPLYQGNGSLYASMVRRSLTEEERAGLGFGRVALHAWKLCFSHPILGTPIEVIAPLPEDFQEPKGPLALNLVH